MTTAAASPIPGSPAAIRARAALVNAYARAFDRAVANRVICYRNADGSYDVPSATSDGVLYVVRHLGGRDWASLTCTCPGANHPACQHRAVVAFARKHHVAAVRPCPPCDDRFCDGDCPDAVGAEEAMQAIMHENAATLLAADPVHERQIALTQKMRDEAAIDRMLALVVGKPRPTIEGTIIEHQRLDIPTTLDDLF